MLHRIYFNSNAYVKDKHPLVVIKTREFWTLWFMFLTNGQAVQFTAALYKVSSLETKSLSKLC
jgi:hypothetical protein